MQGLYPQMNVMQLLLDNVQFPYLSVLHLDITLRGHLQSTQPE